MSESASTTNELNTNENKEIPANDSKSEAFAEGTSSERESSEPLKVNDATLLGEVSPAALSLALKLGFGKGRLDKRWPAKVMTYSQLITGLSKHVEGPKDGAAYMQGTAIGNERKVPAIDALYVMGLDIDSGIHPKQATAKLQEHGLTAIVHTTHSHLKRDTFLVESAFNQWCKRVRIESEATLENVKRYLSEERKWESWIIDTVEIGDVGQMVEGKGWWLSHDPMPKFRVVFPLNEPFVIAKQHCSQLEAIKLWKAKLVGLAKVLGLPIDEACLDPSRLFYMPRHDKGRPFEVWITGGDALDFDAIPEGKLPGRGNQSAGGDDSVWSRAGDDLAATNGNTFVVNGFSLKRWAREVAADFDIASLFRECAPDKIREDQSADKLTVKCPFDSGHGNPEDEEDTGTYVQSAAPHLGVGSFLFSCSHNSCKGRDRLSFVAEAVTQNWFTVDDLKDSKYRLSGGQDQSEDDFDGGRTFGKVDEVVAAMNKVAAAVQIGGDTVYLVCQDNGEETNFKKKSAAADWFANWRYVYTDDNNKEHNEPAFNVWLKSDNRRQYNKIVFRPDGVRNPKHYNTWTGFGVEPKEGVWTLTKRHLFEVWCSCDPELFEYTLAWFAQTFQQPEVKPGVALFVVGPKGTGKSIMKRSLYRIYDTHMTTLSAAGALTSEFNDHMEGKLFVIGEEVVWPGNRAAIGPLKAAITETKVRVNKKFIPAYELDNFARFILFSNEDRAIPAEGNDERRFFALKAGSEHIQDATYFAALVNEMDHGGAEAMLHDLLHFDFRRVELRNPPKTEALAAQIEANLEGPAKWWLSVLTDGAFVDDEGNLSVETDKWEEGKVQVPRPVVFDAYNAAVRTFGMVQADSASIGKFLQKVCPAVTTKKNNTDRWYVFPPLAECREAFEKVAGVRFGQAAQSARSDESKATRKFRVVPPGAPGPIQALALARIEEAGEEMCNHALDREIALVIASMDAFWQTAF